MSTGRPLHRPLCEGELEGALLDSESIGGGTETPSWAGPEKCGVLGMLVGCTK
jgi:hypothetical protein